MDGAAAEQLLNLLRDVMLPASKSLGGSDFAAADDEQLQRQQGADEREAALDARDDEQHAIRAAQEQRQAALDAREAALYERAALLERGERALTKRERAIARREEGKVAEEWLGHTHTQEATAADEDSEGFFSMLGSQASSMMASLAVPTNALPPRKASSRTSSRSPAGAALPRSHTASLEPSRHSVAARGTHSTPRRDVEPTITPGVDPVNSISDAISRGRRTPTQGASRATTPGASRATTPGASRATTPRRNRRASHEPSSSAGVMPWDDPDEGLWP